MTARTKFLAGGALVLATVGYLMASGIKETGVYYLTPTELTQKVGTDRGIYDMGLKMGARVVKGSMQRDVVSQVITFRITDGTSSFPVRYRGLAKNTARLFSCFALANLYLLRRRLLTPQGTCPW